MSAEDRRRIDRRSIEQRLPFPCLDCKRRFKSPHALKMHADASHVPDIPEIGEEWFKKASLRMPAQKD